MTQVLILLWLFLTQSTPSNNYQLDVKIDNVKSQQGIIKVCVFDNEEDFFGKAIKCIEVTPIGNTEISARFEDLPAGTYAVIAYHDVNHNGKLDRNHFGIPSEPYGFSNNPSTLFGPPSFNRANLKLGSNQKIRIRL